MSKGDSPLALFAPPSCWLPLARLERGLAHGDERRVSLSYAALLRCLLDRGFADLVHALAEPLFEASALSRAARSSADLPGGLVAAAEHDLVTLARLAARPWHDDACALGLELPPLRELAPEAAADGDIVALLARAQEPAGRAELMEALVERYRTSGSGVLSRYRAFSWSGTGLEGVADTALDVAEGRLIGVERELERLHANTEAFMDGLPAGDVLLYGPRGSGKSTAVRALAGRYGAQGLRLVELPLERLAELPAVLEALEPGVHHYLLFVDDLSFEEGDPRYGPLRTLLEGTVRARPPRVLLYATSNRRHLVRERFSDRPDPLDDDVHAWDTLHERLALADRFAVTITFPSADQRRYLAIVRALIEREAPTTSQEELDDILAYAVRFAERKSGYSGRTARHFLDSLKARQRR